MALKYVGAGMGAAVDNVPARDLTDSEVDLFGGEKALLALKCADLPLYIKESRGGKDGISSVGVTFTPEQRADIEAIGRAKQTANKEGNS